MKGIIGQISAQIKLQFRAMNEPSICDLCGASIAPHSHYVVRIDVYADPSLPAMTTEELEMMDMDATFTKLLEQMKSMSADELQDQVYRRFEYRLCRECQKMFLSNPLGKPRTRRLAEN